MSLSGDIISDMELDASIEAIGEIAGSINLDGSGSTPTITASATVSPDPGIPACNVVKTGTDEYPNFAFNFSGLKGEQGSQGIPGEDGADGSDGITPDISATASASNTTGVPSVTVTRTGTDAAPNFDFAFENLKGERGVAGPTGETGPQGPSGNDGVTPNITATGSVSNTTGVPSVTITKTGTDLAPTFDFAFENIKGEQGVQGDPGRNGADGADGVTPIIAATASVDDAVGIPNVVITRSGTDAAPNYDFAFHNLKGTQGSPGEGVPSGGSADQVLVKQSSTDYDAAWETLIIPNTASDISFDNTGTGMIADDVQEAISELKSNLTKYTTLYESSAGTTGNVTLSDDVDNYDYIKIFYKYNTYCTSSVEVYDYSSYVDLTAHYMSAWQGTSYMQIGYKRCSFSGNTITNVDYGYANLFHGRSPEIDRATNYISIYKVIGVKLPS